MYYPIVLQCTQGLKNIEAWLDQAEHHASARQFDVGVLRGARGAILQNDRGPIITDADGRPRRLLHHQPTRRPTWVRQTKPDILPICTSKGRLCCFTTHGTPAARKPFAMRARKRLQPAAGPLLRPRV